MSVHLPKAIELFMSSENAHDAEALAEWSHRIGSWKKQGCDVFVYFDNDQKSAAPADALKLRLLLER